MFALLKFVPLKDWLYGAMIVALLAAFGAYTVHERHIGEAKIEKKDAALRAAATALNAASERLAEIKEIDVGHTYEKIILQSPIANAPGLVCVNSAPAAEQPQTANGGPGAAGTKEELRDGSFNPSGELLTLLRDDDAQITGLIDTVLILENELEGRTK